MDASLVANTRGQLIDLNQNYIHSLGLLIEQIIKDAENLSDKETSQVLQKILQEAQNSRNNLIKVTEKLLDAKDERLVPRLVK